MATLVIAVYFLALIRPDSQCENGQQPLGLPNVVLLFMNHDLASFSFGDSCFALIFVQEWSGQHFV